MARVHVSIVKGLIAKSDIVIVYIKKDQKRTTRRKTRAYLYMLKIVIVYTPKISSSSNNRVLNEIIMYSDDIYLD